MRVVQSGLNTSRNDFGFSDLYGRDFQGQQQPEYCLGPTYSNSHLIRRFLNDDFMPHIKTNSRNVNDLKRQNYKIFKR